MLGHIISKDGIRIKPTRIEAILQIPHPRNIKEHQAFLGKINILRRFISNLAKLITLLNNMLKKDLSIKWIVEAKKSFEEIKLSLTRTPVLISPMFYREFIIFSFSFEHSIAAVLLQKNYKGFEQPIAFFSKDLRDASLKYNIMKKKFFFGTSHKKILSLYFVFSHYSLCPKCCSQGHSNIEWR